MEFQVSGTQQELYTKLKEKLSGFVAAGKLPYVKNLDYKDAAHSVSATGSGFKVEIQCFDGRVAVAMELNLVLRALKSQIEDQVKKAVTKIYG